MPHAHIFLHGHGGWKPSDGYTQVPRKSSVRFYTHFAKLLHTSAAYPLLQNNYQGEVEREIGEYMTCPDMVLYSLSVAQRQTADNLFVGGGGRNLFMLPAVPPNHERTLSQLMESFRDAVATNVELTFHWLACQDVGLTPVGGGRHGVNAGDLSQSTIGGNNQYVLLWEDDHGNQHQQFTTSQSTFNT